MGRHPKVVTIAVGVLLALLAIGVTQTQGAEVKHEKDYQNDWCDKAKGIREYRLDDGARVDCLTLTHAVEVEYAHKWAESIGQSLYYAIKTGKKPGVLVIVGEGEEELISRLMMVARRYKITVWEVQR